MKGLENKQKEVFRVFRVRTRKLTKPILFLLTITVQGQNDEKESFHNRQ